MTGPRPLWIVDADKKYVLHQSGALYRIERKDGQWTARTDNPEPFRSIVEREGGEARVAEALDQWLGETGCARDLLADAGRALHGERWKHPLAKDLAISRNTPKLWCDGTTPITVTHPIFVKLRELLRDRLAPLAAVHQRISRAIAERPAPLIVSKRYATGLSPAEDGPAAPDQPEPPPEP